MTESIQTLEPITTTHNTTLNPPRLIPVETTLGVQEEPVFNITNFPYSKIRTLPLTKNKNVTYYNIPCAYDIETTNREVHTEDGRTCYAYMYHWQMCIDRYVIFRSDMGRVG